MKLKGIHPLEQHADKAFLGLMGVVLLGSLASQFLLQPNHVKVGKEEGLPPQDAMIPVAKAARELQGKLNATEPTLPEVTVGPLVEEFTTKMAAPVAGRRTLASLGEGLKLGGAAVSEVVGDRVFATVEVPQPGSAVANAFRSTIDPYERVSHAGLASLLPAQQPFDKASVSIQASFNGQELKAALQKDPDDSGPIEPVLQSWWRDIDILGIEVERQEQKSDGSWGDSTILPSLPGRVDMKKFFNDTVRGAGDIPLAAQAVRQGAEQIRRPAYYRTISGPEWTPPEEASDDTSVVVDQSKDKLTRKKEELARVEANIERLKTAPESTTTPRDGGEGRGGGIGGGGRGGRGAPPPPTNSPSGTTPKLSPKEQQIRSQELRAERIRAEIAKMEGEAAPTGAAPGAATAGAPTTGEAALLENASVQVWTHDLTAQTGKTYRYRLRAMLINPFFGRQASLKGDQQALATQRMLPSPWSDWTGAVSIDPDEYYFMTTASERDGIDSPRATFELFKFYYGYYRKGSVTVYPGDTLAAEMRLPPTLKIYDLEKLKAAVAVGGSASTPAGGAESPAGRGGRGGRFGGGEGRNPGDMSAPPSERPAPPDERAPPPEAPAVAELPPADGSWTAAPKSVRLAVDAILLDVAPSPTGDSRTAFEAYLRLAGGIIGIREQSRDVRDPSFARLTRSAEQGVNAAKPKDAERGPNQGRPNGQEVEPPAPPSRPSGGGGGGGG